MRRPAFRGRQIALLAFSILCLVGAAYWLASLHRTLPGHESLRRTYESRTRKMGVGSEYTSGPFLLAGLAFLGVTGLRSLPWRTPSS